MQKVLIERHSIGFISADVNHALANKNTNVFIVRNSKKSKQAIVLTLFEGSTECIPLTEIWSDTTESSFVSRLVVCRGILRAASSRAPVLERGHSTLLLSLSRLLSFCPLNSIDKPANYLGYRQASDVPRSEIRQVVFGFEFWLVNSAEFAFFRIILVNYLWRMSEVSLSKFLWERGAMESCYKLYTWINHTLLMLLLQIFWKMSQISDFFKEKWVFLLSFAICAVRYHYRWFDYLNLCHSGNLYSCG